MIQEIKLKYYNSRLRIGFNDLRRVYSTIEDRWLTARVHAGRLVYGNKYIPYSKIKKGIDRVNYSVPDYCPF